MARDIPGAVQQVLAQPDADRQAKLDAFSVKIAGLRDDAVLARKALGIEDVWMACEEAYLGIDDATRPEFTRAKWSKPMSMEGPVTARGHTSDGTKSTAFVRLTSRYVDAGAAKIGEITQPIDDMPFKLDPTPVPDLIAGKEDLRAVLDGGQPVMREATSQDGQADAQVPLTVKDLAEKQLEKAADAAEKASKRIYDWMIEGKRPAQMRKVVFDAARLGSGVLKGPVPKRKAVKAVTKVDGAVALQIKDATTPVSVWVDLWNLFPSEDCGEDIHEGSYIVERDFLSPPALRKLKDQPNYLPEAIDKVLKEGPGKCYMAQGVNPAQGEDKKRFVIWYFYGEVETDDLAAINAKAADSARGSSVFAIVTMVNDTAIKAIINPLDSGSFPYHVVNWRRRAGSWAGVGVAEQARLPQVMVNSATRALLNNAGKSAGSQIVLSRGTIVPADGVWNVTPDKMWWQVEDSPLDDVRKAFVTFQVPNMTPQLMSVIEYGFKLAEESTSIPLISQGQSGETAPDTFGATQLQNNNANQLLRDVGFAFADQITNPEVEQYYEWLLLDPDIPEDEKGDFQVNCNASAAAVERAIQDQTIAQMAPMVSNPAFGIDPKRWAKEMMRTKRLDSRAFMFSEEEQAAQEKNQPPPLPLAVAQVRAQSAEKIAASRDQASVEKVKADTDRDTAYVNAEAKRADDNAQARLEELQIKREIANLDYQTKLMEFATRKEISLEKAKTELAKEAMGLNVQRELAGVDGTGPQVTAPPTEPAGRAPNGEAFQR